ncbi:erythromycin resistance leader peptide [Staphylococcus aureus]|nr:erythromycin resistance leader peptide [Staphylococcus aureus]
MGTIFVINKVRYQPNQN